MLKQSKWISVAAGVSAVGLALAGCGSSTAASTKTPGSSSGSASASSATSSAASYFKGKTIQFIIPHPVGGGFDYYSRTLIKYMQKYMPGTTIVPVNKTGAGGLLGTKLIMSAKPNGLTLGILATDGLVLDQIAGKPTLGFKVQDISWLGRISADTPAIAVGAKSTVQSFANWKNSKTPVKFAQSGVGSGDYITVKFISKELNLPTNVITGFKGSSADNQAVLNGSVQATESSLGSLRTEIQSKEFRPILIVGPSARKSAPGTPTIVQVSKSYSSSVQTAMKTWANFEALNRAVGGPTGIPASRLTYLRSIMQKAMTDPGFIAATTKAHREIAFMPGSQYSSLVSKEVTAIAGLKSVLSTIPGL